MSARNDEAISIFKSSAPSVFAYLYLADVYASTGQYADALREVPPETFSPGMLEDAMRLLRAAPARAVSTRTALQGSILNFVYLYTGQPDLVLDYFERFAAAGYAAPANISSVLWEPPYSPVRKTGRFTAYLRKAGFVDYWRARGWPDLCRPVGADDFVCD